MSGWGLSSKTRGASAPMGQQLWEQRVSLRVGMDAEIDILIIEDDQAFREDLCRRLNRIERLDANFVVCEELAEGREALESQLFDVGLFDYSLPDGNALEFVQELVGRHGGTVAPIIITSLTDAETRADILAAGAEDYLIKGDFDDATLERSILYALARSRGQHLRERVERLGRLQQLGDFAADMAHQINNPLAVMSNNLQFMKRLYEQVSEGSAPNNQTEGLLDDWGELLEESSGALERLTQLVRDVQLLRGPKIEDVVPCDVNELIRKGARRVIGEYDNIDMEFDLVDVPMIGAEWERLTKAFAAAIENAAEAAVRGDHEPEVRVTTKRARQGVRVEIDDNGPGMIANDIEKHFRPFSTTKPPSQGRGLGLPLILQIVRAHGGTLDVESSEKGTTLTIWLPKDPAGLGDTPIETLYDDTDIDFGNT